MWEIWANKLLPKVLKSCPKSNKSPNLVTMLLTSKTQRLLPDKNKTKFSLVWKDGVSQVVFAPTYFYVLFKHRSFDQQPMS